MLQLRTSLYSFDICSCRISFSKKLEKDSNAMWQLWQLWQWHSPFLEISSSEQRLPQPVVREHKVARERGRAGERAWLAAPSKARFQGSQGLVRFSNPLLYPPPSKAARLLAGCSKAHACCNLPPPMISCSFLKLLSGGIESLCLPSSLSQDAFYWTNIFGYLKFHAITCSVCRGRVTKGLGFALSSSLLWFLLDLRYN